jgi:hypothetical protein
MTLVNVNGSSLRSVTLHSSISSRTISVSSSSWVGISGGWGTNISVEVCQKRKALAALLKIGSDSMGHDDAERPTEKEIRSFWLDHANLVNIVSGHLLNGSWAWLWPSETTRLHSIDRIVGIKMFS